MAKEEENDIQKYPGLRGRGDAGEYYWRGEPRDRRAYSRQYAEARDEDKGSDFMKNVAAGGRNFDAAKMK